MGELCTAKTRPRSCGGLTELSEGPYRIDSGTSQPAQQDDSGGGKRKASAEAIRPRHRGAGAGFARARRRTIRRPNAACGPRSRPDQPSCARFRWRYWSRRRLPVVENVDVAGIARRVHIEECAARDIALRVAVRGQQAQDIRLNPSEGHHGTPVRSARPIVAPANRLQPATGE